MVVAGQPFQVGDVVEPLCDGLFGEGVRGYVADDRGWAGTAQDPDRQPVDATQFSDGTLGRLVRQQYRIGVDRVHEVPRGRGVVLRDHRVPSSGR